MCLSKLVSAVGPSLTNCPAHPMSGIGPEAEVDEHALLGFGPSHVELKSVSSKSADQILASVKRFCLKTQRTLCGELRIHVTRSKCLHEQHLRRAAQRLGRKRRTLDPGFQSSATVENLRQPRVAKQPNQACLSYRLESRCRGLLGCLLPRRSRAAPASSLPHRTDGRMAGRASRLR
jgi:hypothetical protein